MNLSKILDLRRPVSGYLFSAVLYSILLSGLCCLSTGTAVAETTPWFRPLLGQEAYRLPAGVRGVHFPSAGGIFLKKNLPYPLLPAGAGAAGRTAGSRLPRVAPEAGRPGLYAGTAAAAGSRLPQENCDNRGKIDLNIRFNGGLNRYEVYARPTDTEAGFIMATAQVSVRLPASFPKIGRAHV
jgi:hypothetical protein